MNVHDPDDPETDPGRTSSPLPQRTAALDTVGRVPTPRAPGDGPIRPQPAPAPTIPVARSEPPPRTPPMPWSAVAAPAEPPAAPPHSPRAGARRAPAAWWSQLQQVMARRTLERRVAAGLAVTVALVGSAALVLALSAQPPVDEQAVAHEQAGPPVDADDIAEGARIVDGSAFGGDAWLFRSPTGNIECRMADDGSRCTIGNRRWQMPQTVPDCPAANGTVVLSGSDPGFVSCEPSSSRSADALAYDRALRRGEVTCVSRRDGVECRDASTGHGFAVARAEYHVY